MRIITSAVIVQITTVSINGSSIATNPCVRGSLVLTVAWAIAEDPIPASLEKAARRKPKIRTATMPPVTPSGLKALVMIAETAEGIAEKLVAEDLWVFGNTMGKTVGS